MWNEFVIKLKVIFKRIIVITLPICQVVFKKLLLEIRLCFRIARDEIFFCLPKFSSKIVVSLETNERMSEMKNGSLLNTN